ncbi:MAG: hypothetical protein ACOCX2_06945 [Armatimonadota bacterium]
MTCKQVQAELVECWASIELLSAAVVEHIDGCEECRHQALLLRETHVMVQALPRESTPDGFTRDVMARLEAEERRSGWLGRLSEMFVPARQPSWARAAAVGTAIALAVAGGTVWYNQAQEPAPQPQVAGIAATPQMASGAIATDGLDEAELEELLARHQAHEMTQPLADDAGVSLVVYTSN